MPLPKGAHALDERRDGLVLRRNHRLHERIAYHEIRCRCVFIDQQRPSAGLEGLHGRRRLRGASACVFRAERARIATIWKVVYERGDIDRMHEATVFRAQLDRRLIGCHKFAPIARNMVVYTLLQCFEQSRLAMVATAHDEGDAPANAHAAHTAAMGQLERHAHAFGRGEGPSARKRLRRDTARPWQDRAVRNKGHEAPLPHRRANRPLVVGQFRCLLSRTPPSVV